MPSPIFILQQSVNPGLIKLIFFLIVFGFSFLSWVFRKLQEQAAKKKARDAVERRKLESLRTGRTISEPVAVPTDPAEAARQEAAKRRAQIEELRRRQQERVRQQAAAKTAPPTARPSTPPRDRPVARPLPPIVKIPGSTGPTVPQTRPLPTPKPARPAPKRPVAKRPEPKPEPRRIAAPLTTQQPAPTAPAPAGPAGVSGAQPDRPRTPADWRRAIIMNEILSPPVSVREQADTAGLDWPAGEPRAGSPR